MELTSPPPSPYLYPILRTPLPLLGLYRSPLRPKKLPHRRRLIQSITLRPGCEGGGGSDEGAEARPQAHLEAHVFVLHPGQVHHGEIDCFPSLSCHVMGELLHSVAWRASAIVIFCYV
jgi:hypothetical protein